ncbi:hypothetical protein N7527_008008 [Penicillium freii]|nr:hypothetical protein N7527_008008 [Penicillium freii]
MSNLQFQRLTGERARRDPAVVSHRGVLGLEETLVFQGIRICEPVETSTDYEELLEGSVIRGFRAVDNSCLPREKDEDAARFRAC